MERFRYLLLFSILYSTSLYAMPFIDMNDDIAMRIGVKIWYNECNGKISGLTSWNEGESFASVGIGHFNWYPAPRNSSKDGFSQLIKYMEERGFTVAIWLAGEKVPPCPWRSRKEFLAAKQTERMRELEQFLVDTIPIQAKFMMHRLVVALPSLILKEPLENRVNIYDYFEQLSRTPQGVYALVDYVNFKGEGFGSVASYKRGWGLLQVLEGMQDAPFPLEPIQAFVWSANRALTERVNNASSTSHEHRWLAGWRKRIGTYLD